MDSNTPIFDQDLREVEKASFIPWNELENKTIFITGATGLIGAGIIYALDYINAKKELGIHIIALVRDLDKARNRFDDLECKGMLRFVVGNVENFTFNDIELDDVDYIIHGASKTASGEFIRHTVETIDTAVLGTRHVLEMANIAKVKGFVYLSSMEVYGYPQRGHKVKENEIGSFDPSNLRNCYPISKILCENLCRAFASEYCIPTRVIRLTQTFGPGVDYNDNRIFAYFARCIKEGKDIVLKTKGETERCYLYTPDAVTAILTVLLKGKDGEIYNAADEKTYCSIADMAEKVAKQYNLKVRYEIEPPSANGYPDTLYMYLDTSKIQALGWLPIGGGTSIEEMFKQTVSGFWLER